MPAPHLHGNGLPCPACALQREARGVPRGFGRVPGLACNRCGGTGLVAKSAARIVAEALRAAREGLAWPPKPGAEPDWYLEDRG